MITVVVKFVDKAIFTQDFSGKEPIIVKVEDAKNKFYLEIFVGGRLVLISPLENIEYYFTKHKNEESLREIHGDTTVKHYDYFNKTK